MPDVVVIGAGLAGLSCATRLVAEGAEVIVLEARERVGGRTEGGQLPDGTPVELGGQWLGPTQHRMHELAAELGLELFPTHVTGDAVYAIGGRRQRKRDGANPPLGVLATADVGAGLLALNRRAGRVDAERPWEAPGAEALDARTFADWIRRRPTPTGRRFWEIATRAVFSAEPADLSLLHVLAYVHGAGSWEQLLDTHGGAQQDRFVGGSHQVAERLAARLGDRVRLGCAVTGLERGPAGVTVATTARERIAADRAVVALPPTLAGRLSYEPALPAARDQLTQRVPMGAVLKVHVQYETPFWREDGLSGTALSDGPDVQVVFDNSPPDGSSGVLLAFVEGRDAVRWGRRPEAELHAAVVRRLAALISPRAAHPVAVVSRDWTAEPFSRGCYGGYLPPGVWTTYGQALREPVGPVHWAGAECGPVWAGYMEGAVRSGEATAERVLADLDAPGRAEGAVCQP